MVRRAGVVSGHLRRSGGGPAWISPRAFARVLHPELCLFPIGLAGHELDGSDPRRGAAGVVGGFRAHASGARSRPGEALHRVVNGARVFVKRSFHRLLELLLAWYLMRKLPLIFGIL